MISKVEDYTAEKKLVTVSNLTKCTRSNKCTTLRLSAAIIIEILMISQVEDYTAEKKLVTVSN